MAIKEYLNDVKQNIKIFERFVTFLFLYLFLKLAGNGK
jgi:hypothetical protein